MRLPSGKPRKYAQRGDTGIVWREAQRIVAEKERVERARTELVTTKIHHRLRLIRSVVSFGEKERQIGESGAIARMRNLKNTVCNAKLLLGKNWDNTIAQREIANQVCSLCDGHSHL